MPECRVAIAPIGTDGDTSTTGEFAELVLPEQGMCLAVRKACPHLFARETEYPQQEGRGVSLLGDVIPRFLQCDLYAPVCRKVS